MASPSPLSAALFAALFIALAMPLAPPAHAEEAPAGASPGFVPIEDIVVPVVVKTRLRGYLLVRGTLEFGTPDQAKSAEAWVPRVQDAWVRTLNGLAARGHFDDAIIDVDMLKKHLFAAVASAFGNGTTAHDVLIVRALFQKVNG
ncbi:hypothetical protein [Azospirillum sp. SYSU D00513]|uniref:hypothetical protein n=1 Tax=Azospirillum sp. SYSU D00513 TaxID=2812561 RepID=UPI001A96F653|nr:hypothetical protein [Azospirillum sp. SYSU D00513]